MIPAPRIPPAMPPRPEYPRARRLASPAFDSLSFEEIDRRDLNSRLIAWGHRIGPVRRPSQGWSHGLFHRGELVAVAATDRLIRERVAGLDRSEAIELSRLCSSRTDLNRVALRLWRAFVFPHICMWGTYRWGLSYQDTALHSGGLYRFDGWVRLAVSRSGRDGRTGRKGRSKVIWGWCDDAQERSFVGMPNIDNAL